MFLKILRGLTVVITIIVAAALAYERYGTSKGNTLVDEARVLFQGAADKAAKVAPQFKELVSDENTKGFPGNRAKLEPQARAVAAAFGEVVEQYRAAGAKLDEAGKQPTDQIIAEYWALLGQEFAKSAEKYELVRDYALLVTDPKIETVEVLEVRRSEIDAKVDQVTKEEKAFSAKSDKIKAEHPELLK